MSTRAHIRVHKGLDIHYVYHHCDGYPEGVGQELRDFLETPGISSIKDPEEFCRSLESWNSSYEFEDSGIHGDEEYVYDIFLHKTTTALTCSERDIMTGTEKILPEFTTTVVAPGDTKSDDLQDLSVVTEILSETFQEFLKSPTGKKCIHDALKKYYDEM